MNPQRTDADPVLSVVVPVHNEEANLPELHRRLGQVLLALDGPAEIVYVDDGSSDRSVELIKEWVAAGELDVSLVKLSRNFGMEIAMSAGLDYAHGRNVALMHADLQDPPELLREMLDAVLAGADVAYARRIGSDESAIKRILATGFYTLMRRVARVPYQGQAGDFRVMSARVVEAIKRMPERRRFLRGMVAWVGYNQVPIEYRRAGRHGGRGASYPQLMRLALEALTAFSDVPLQLATLFGIVIAQLSALGAIVILLLTVTGAVHPSVWIWVLVAVLFLSGIQLTTAGILGRYLARVHAEVLARPLYLVDTVVRAGSEPAPSSNARGAVPTPSPTTRVSPASAALPTGRETGAPTQ
jgi:dolichol-phosphate mannosyltransferase